MNNQQIGSLASAIAAKLIELEQAADRMALQDVYKEYRSFGWDVSDQPNSLGPFITANNNWTEKGFRHFLALLELYEFFGSEYEVQKGGAS